MLDLNQVKPTKHAMVIKKPTRKSSTKMEYTIREAAELRGVSTKTVRRKILRGQIHAELKFVELLRSNIYFIPRRELRKITAEPGGRPKLVQ